MIGQLGETKLHVTLIEENPVEREYLRALVAGAPGVALAASYGGISELLSKVGSDQPDLLVVDLDSPQNSSADWLRQLHHLLPHTPVLVLSSERGRDHLFRSLESGVAGWLQKPCTADQLVRAILVVQEGGAVLSSPVAQRLLEFFHARGLSVESLTTREREILDLLAQGLSNKEIGARLELSPFTVKNHLARVFEKLHVRCRTEAVMAYLHSAPGSASAFSP